MNSDGGALGPRQAAVLETTLRIQSNDCQMASYPDQTVMPQGRYASQRELRRAEFWRSLTTHQ
jgi:hypothetical protein